MFCTLTDGLLMAFCCQAWREPPKAVEVLGGQEGMMGRQAGMCEGSGELLAYTQSCHSCESCNSRPPPPLRTKNQNSDRPQESYSILLQCRTRSLYIVFSGP